MIFYYVAGADRSADVSESSLTINNQIQQRSDNCQFEIFQNAKPVANQDIKIYDGDKVASQAGAVITLQGLFQTGVSKFYPGQQLWLRVGQANAEQATVLTYVESTLTLTLTASPAIGLSTGDKIGEIIFGGVVARVQDQNLVTLQNLVWNVSGVDYTKVFDKKIVAAVWTNVDTRYILNDAANSTINYNMVVDALSYASNGAIQAAWTQSGDGAAPTVDASDFLEATSSGVFGWTFAGGTATWVTSFSAKNFSDLTGVNSGTPTKGQVMIWPKFADITKVTNIKLRLGSSNANYATMTYVPTVNADWGYLSATLAGSTITGNPDWTAVTYAAIIVTQTATSSVKLNGFRVNDSSSFTMYNLQPSSSITEYRAGQIKPTQLANDLAKAFEFVWYVDYNRDLHFVPNATVAAPQSITDVSNNFTDLRIDTDISNIGNRIIINGGSTDSLSRYSQVIQGDNVQRGWIVKSPFDSMVIKVDNNTTTHAAEAGTTTTNIKITGHGLAVNDWVVNRTRSVVRQVTAVVDANNFTVQAVTAQTNGDTISYFSITQTVGIEGIGNESAFDYMGNSTNQSVRASSQTAVLPVTSYIQFSYFEIIPIEIQYQDSASISALKALGLGDGIFDLATITDANITDQNTAILTAQAKVAEFSNPLITGSFKTDKHGLRSGQLITINQTIQRGFSGTYVIQKVNMKQRAGQYQDYIDYSVTFGTTLFGWIELMQKILKTGAFISNNTNQIVETFVTSDEVPTASDVDAVAVDGGFLNAKNTETPTTSEANSATITNTPWKWEVSSGQPLQTRWDLFSWS